MVPYNPRRERGEWQTKGAKKTSQLFFAPLRLCVNRLFLVPVPRPPLQAEQGKQVSSIQIRDWQIDRTCVHNLQPFQLAGTFRQDNNRRGAR